MPRRLLREPAPDGPAWTVGRHTVGGARPLPARRGFPTSDSIGGHDNGAAPVEYVLAALGGCLTAGIASIAQRRGI
ncbi:OsmC family protein [Mycobacterium kansasii]|uniref:OsmC family protein n=1 Tax=Mycobacterium kansasii TaxID=1768 RepID=UPI003CCBA0B4